jgi:uncharacterized peroxidase-related enzyme
LNSPRCRGYPGVIDSFAPKRGIEGEGAGEGTASCRPLHSSGNEAFTSGERELVASFVSSRNTCYVCQTSHGAAAAQLHGTNAALVNAICTDYRSAPISNKLKVLLTIAEEVQMDGKRVTPELVQQACAERATDLDIHDTVLIAAAFRMYNRYVDGLATWRPRDSEVRS